MAKKCIEKEYIRCDLCRKSHNCTVYYRLCQAADVFDGLSKTTDSNPYRTSFNYTVMAMVAEDCLLFAPDSEKIELENSR